MSLPDSRKDVFHVASDYQPLVRQVGLDAQAVFNDPRIVPWRMLPDRENCTIDVDLPGGDHVRWHIKRYAAQNSRPTPAEIEARGHQLLLDADIPTASLIAFGSLSDGRSFTIFDDLSGYKPADKLLEAGTPFDLLLEPTAELAARLHEAGLHHRDLYLCHFMARVIEGRVDLRLIDSARVTHLPGVLSRRRWIIKDLAQFWYSTLKHEITDPQRLNWLGHYARKRGFQPIDALRRQIERKSRSIARHDRRLHQKRPQRDVSIPT